MLKIKGHLVKRDIDNVKNKVNGKGPLVLKDKDKNKVLYYSIIFFF